MKINKDLYIKDLIKTNQTTSDNNSYSCTYVNDKISDVNTTIDNLWKKTYLSTHSSGLDLNDYTKDGFYHFDTVSNLKNAPTNGWYPSMNYFLVVINANVKGNVNSTNLVQLWCCASPSQDQYKGMWMRTRCYSTWYGWVKL